MISSVAFIKEIAEAIQGTTFFAFVKSLGDLGEAAGALKSLLGLVK